MQKATSAITIPHIISRLCLHSLQRPNHKPSIQLLTLRFKVHGTLQINQSIFLGFNLAFVRVYRES
jgi:hypothetical protein